MRQEAFWSVVSCPHCHGNIHKNGNTSKCENCGRKYSKNNNNQFDFRIQDNINIQADYTINSDYGENKSVNVFSDFTKSQDENDNINYDRLPQRDKKLLSYLPDPEGEAVAVEVGTIGGRLKSILEEAGYEYIGMDVKSPDAPLLADGRSLPISDDSADVVICSRVLEHVRHPYLVIKEFERILKSGGRFIGSVAFLEPWHMYSNYHMSHYGVYNLLSQFEFEINWISPDIHGLRPISYMGLFRRIPKDWMAEILVYPLILLNIIWYKIGYLYTGSEFATELNRKFRISSGVNFCADKT